MKAFDIYSDFFHREMLLLNTQFDISFYYLDIRMNFNAKQCLNGRPIQSLKIQNLVIFKKYYIAEYFQTLGNWR